MSKGRILVVEDDVDIAVMLRTYFSSQGYETIIARDGGEAMQKAEQLPQAIIRTASCGLDIMLPDFDGYEVCRRLRANPRTGHIPIIFLTQKDERSDKVAGFEMGGDDYITKPFHLDELRLRVQAVLRRAGRESLTNPTTGLPGGKLVEEQLRSLMRRKGWSLLYIGINHLEPFNAKYGFVMGDAVFIRRSTVLRFAALLMAETVDEYGTSDGFIGHIGGDDFIIITRDDKAEAVNEAITEQFNAEVRAYYDYTDQEVGHLVLDDRHYPFMTLAIGVVNSEEKFAGIHEITEVAARRRARQAS